MIGEAKMLVRPAFTISGELKRYHNLENMLWGKSLLEGIERCTSTIYTAACRNLSPGELGQHYLVQNKTNNPVEWQFASGLWASFEYFGLHPLDDSGVTRIRILMSQVIGNWFIDNGAFWDSNFTETINLGKCTENYCELNFCCFSNTI